jgi:hypothetical protein
MLPESRVHQGLVVPSARSVNLLAKPLEHVIIDPDRDPGLAG